jgi:hypothetical protein
LGTLLAEQHADLGQQTAQCGGVWGSAVHGAQIKVRTAPGRTRGVVDEYFDVFGFGICQAIRLGVRWQAANTGGDCRGHADLLHASSLALYGLVYSITLRIIWK